MIKIQEMETFDEVQVEVDIINLCTFFLFLCSPYNTIQTPYKHQAEWTNKHLHKMNALDSWSSTKVFLGILWGDFQNGAMLVNN